VYRGGKQFHKSSFVIFYLDSDEKRFGFTSSKRVGNAILRNRGKRVLKSIVLQHCENMKSGYYVIVAKEALNKMDYSRVQADFEKGIRYLKLYENR